MLAELGYPDHRADAEWIENNLEAIARSLSLSVTEYVGVPFLSPRPEREWVVTVNSGNLLLRGVPATTARILARMPNGAPVRILNSYDDWSVVDYDGLLGWAKSEYLRPDVYKRQRLKLKQPDLNFSVCTASRVTPAASSIVSIMGIHPFSACLPLLYTFFPEMKEPQKDFACYSGRNPVE